MCYHGKVAKPLRPHRPKWRPSRDHSSGQRLFGPLANTRPGRDTTQRGRTGGDRRVVGAGRGAERLVNQLPFDAQRFLGFRRRRVVIQLMSSAARGRCVAVRSGRNKRQTRK